MSREPHPFSPVFHIDVSTDTRDVDLRDQKDAEVRVLLTAPSPSPDPSPAASPTPSASSSAAPSPTLSPAYEAFARRYFPDRSAVGGAPGARRRPSRRAR